MASPTELMKACLRGDIVAANRSIANYTFNEQDTKGNSCLHYAVEGGQVAIVQLLLQKGADVNLQTEKGRTPLIKAAEGGYLSIVKELTKNGADINAKTHNGYTGLLCSVWQNHPDIVKYFLDEKQMSPNVQTIEGVTPLFIAAENGHKNILEMLIRYGTQTNISNIRKATAIHIAAYNGHCDILNILLDHNLSYEAINSGIEDGQTALMLATTEGHSNAVALLLDKNADANISDNNGDTALHLAVQSEHFEHSEILQLLLHYQPKVLRNKDGKSALDLATEQEHSHSVALLTQYQEEVSVMKQPKQPEPPSSPSSQVRLFNTSCSSEFCDSGVSDVIPLQSFSGTQEGVECANRIRESNRVSKEKLSELQHEAQTGQQSLCSTSSKEFERQDLDQTPREAHIWAGFCYIVHDDEDSSLRDDPKEFLARSQAFGDTTVSLSDININIFDKWGSKLDDILKELNALQSPENVDKFDSGWIPSSDFFSTSQASAVQGRTLNTTLTVEQSTTTSARVVSPMEGEQEILDLRESRERVITVQDSDTTVPKVLVDNEVLEQLEFRQTLTEYKITHALDSLQYNKHGELCTPRQCKATGDNLNEGVLSNSNLYHIAHGFGHAWQSLGLLLGRTQPSLEYIQEDYQGRIVHGVVKMLLDWRMSSTKSYHEKVQQLKEALVKSEKQALAARLETI